MLTSESLNSEIMASLNRGSDESNCVFTAIGRKIETQNLCGVLGHHSGKTDKELHKYSRSFLIALIHI